VSEAQPSDERQASFARPYPRSSAPQGALAAFLVPVLLVLPLDQLTKHWVERNIQLGDERIVIEGFFSLTHVLNRGIVFGWFQGGDMLILVALTLAAVALIFAFLRHVPADDRIARTALGLILGGAAGNLIDRLLREAVVDFLHFETRWFTYWDFNVADSAIVLGVAMLLLRRSWREPGQQGVPAALDRARSIQD
jgi:signal peptidase II